MKHKIPPFIFLGIVALLTVFVLGVYAATVIETAVSDVESDYSFDTLASLSSLADNELVGDITYGTPVIGPNDPSIGKDGASVVIIEYGDFQCPFCSQMRDVLAQILTEYDDIQLVWKDLPNSFHSQALSAALAARCANEQGQFWSYHDSLFAQQDQLSPELYPLIAGELGLDVGQFDQCLLEGRYLTSIAAQIDRAQEYGVDATPYLFINDRRVDQFVTYDELSSIIEEER